MRFFVKFTYIVLEMRVRSAMNRRIGIDEAGRGPVLGPMVVALVEWPEQLNSTNHPSDVRIADSKNINPSRRRQTARYLKERINYRICCVPAWILARSDTTIPQVEARVISECLKTFPPREVYCDALGSGSKAHQWIRNHRTEHSFLFESGADDRYPSVSAASILAKTTRDQALERLESTWGQLGSGYPSDPQTQEWLQNRANKAKTWPPFVRTNWKTVKELQN